MKWHKTTVTRKGQVTIPVEIRRVMGLKEGDTVAFVQDGDSVRLAPWIGAVERTAAMLKSDIPIGTPQQEKEAFEHGIAENVVASMNQ